MKSLTKSRTAVCVNLTERHAPQIADASKFYDWGIVHATNITNIPFPLSMLFCNQLSMANYKIVILASPSHRLGAVKRSFFDKKSCSVIHAVSSEALLAQKI